MVSASSINGRQRVCGGVPDIPSVIIHHRQSSTEGVCPRSSSIDNRQRVCLSLSDGRSWCGWSSTERVCVVSSSIDGRQRVCVVVFLTFPLSSSIIDSHLQRVCVVSSSIDNRQRGCVSLSLMAAHGVWWWMVIHRWCALLSFRMADRGCVSVSLMAAHSL